MYNNIFCDRCSKYKKRYEQYEEDKERIIIKLIDRTMGGIVAPTMIYEKTISIEKEKNIGKVYIKDFKRNSTKEYNVNRNQIIDLLQKINQIWTIPSAKNNQDEIYSGILLEIYKGNNSWVNGKPSTCRHESPSVSATNKQQQIYNTVIRTIMNEI